MFENKSTCCFFDHVNLLRIIEFQVKKLVSHVIFIVVLFSYDLVCLSRKLSIVNVFEKKLIMTTTLTKL